MTFNLGWEEFIDWYNSFFGHEMPISFFRLAFIRSNSDSISLRDWAYKYDIAKAEKRQK